MDTNSILLFRKREQERVFELKAQKDTLATQFDDIVSFFHLLYVYPVRSRKLLRMMVLHNIEKLFLAMGKFPLNLAGSTTEVKKSPKQIILSKYY